MKFKSIASPEPSLGVKARSKKLVQPNMALSLEEILRRFTRGEPLAIGQEGNYHDGPDDLEKVRNMDLVDREEYINKMKATQKGYHKQEKDRADKEQERLKKEALDKYTEDLKKQAAAEEAKAK